MFIYIVYHELTLINLTTLRCKEQPRLLSCEPSLTLDFGCCLSFDGPFETYLLKEFNNYCGFGELFVSDNSCRELADKT